MQLPGRLRSTTLGDLLGALHRGRATGTLELVEDRGRTHRVHLADGLVVAVELDGAGASLAEVLRKERAVDDDTLRRSLLRAMASRRLHGEVLVREFALSPNVIGRALRRQVQARLGALDQIADARVVFRVTVRPPRESLTDAPLGPTEFLSGRRRARDRASPATPDCPVGIASDAGARPAWPALDPSAWRVLGLSPGAPEDDIKRAFRRLVRSYHPDMHPGATAQERRALEERFAEVTAAYRKLVA
jgi:hypothetical protein